MLAYLIIHAIKVSCSFAFTMAIKLRVESGRIDSGEINFVFWCTLLQFFGLLLAPDLRVLREKLSVVVNCEVVSLPVGLNDNGILRGHANCPCDFSPIHLTWMDVSLYLEGWRRVIPFVESSVCDVGRLSWTCKDLLRVVWDTVTQLDCSGVRSKSERSSTLTHS